MKKIGIMENGGAAAAVIKGGGDHIAVHGRTSAADTITLKHLIGNENIVSQYKNTFVTLLRISCISVKPGEEYIFVIKTTGDLR